MCENQLTGKDYKNSQADGYYQFEASIQQHFDKVIAGGQKLFTTNVEGLYDLYLQNLPDHAEEHLSARKHYDCNGCRQFIERFGGLVTINENGTMRSVIWDEGIVPDFFVNAVIAMRHAVLTSRVNGVFIPDARVLGTPKTGEWTHLSVRLPQEMINRSVLRTAHQVMAEKKEDFRILISSLQDYSLDTVNQALALIQSETMYRSDRVEGVAKWFKELIEKRENLNANQKTNVTWYAVASAPTGFTHVRSSMIGTLLDDIKSGLSARVVAARFAEKMNPANYMRSQSAPSANAIYEAEKIVKKLGIANSLERRYATIEEIPSFIWENRSSETVNRLKAEQARGGVFGHLTAKAKPAPMALPSSVMTWEKFQRTVLPTAENLEVLMDNPNRFMALVTAADPTAENILQWDNTFSWYYHGGIDGEMKRRVEEAGGRYEDNEIRVSLAWEGLTDLDLHCITPKGEEIYWSHKKGNCDGYLDLDMNGVDKHSETPVENMRWVSRAPQGRYKFVVNNYSEKVNAHRGTPFRAELEINGQVYHYKGEALRNKERVTVFEFDYVKGQQPVFRNNISQSSSNQAWGVPANGYVKVNAITTSPNLWGEKPAPHSGSHIFFLLDGVKDESEGKGRGFFNETLKPELREIRKTLEAFTANTPIQDADKATACGVGYSKDNEWNLTIRVTSNNSTRLIKIDRAD